MKIPLFKIYWDDNDIQAISNVIKSGTYWTTGPTIKEFESNLANYIGTKYAVSFSSGTTALHSALLAHNVNEGDEVIVPSFTFIATANAPLYLAAKPVFCDIEEKTYGLDPEDLKKKITRRTKAIVPIHYGGSPCQIREIKEIAEDNHLLLIEDAAESMGARIGGKKVGTFGDSAILSFCQNKIITTGEGGAVVTDSKEVFEKLKLIRSHGRLEPSNYFSSSDIADYITLGYNYRMPDILAALGLSQLSKIEQIIALRQKNSSYLNQLLSSVKGIASPSIYQDYFNVFQLYTIVVKEGKETRDRLLKYLAKLGISVKIYFSPVHITHFYKNKLKYNCRLPITETVADKVLTLPMYPSLTTKEMDFVVDAIKNFFK